MVGLSHLTDEDSIAFTSNYFNDLEILRATKHCSIIHSLWTLQLVGVAHRIKSKGVSRFILQHRETAEKGGHSHELVMVGAGGEQSNILSHLPSSVFSPYDEKVSFWCSPIKVMSTAVKLMLCKKNKLLCVPLILLLVVNLLVGVQVRQKHTEAGSAGLTLSLRGSLWVCPSISFSDSCQITLMTD